MASSPAEAALAARVKDPGYTPGIRDLGALLDLLREEDEDLARAAERAVLRIEARHAARSIRETVTRARDAKRPARGRLARLVGRLAASAPEEAAAEARAWLASALSDADPKTRHTAARALAKLRPPSAEGRAVVERALLAAWDTSSSDEDRRSLADALGRIGSSAARERLAGAREGSVGQRATRATLMIDRERGRATPGAIDASRAFGEPIALRFHTRAGLEAIVAEEIGDAWRPRVAGSGLVDARLEGPLSRATSVRTAIHVGFPLDPVPVRGETGTTDNLAEAIVRAITDPRALAVMRAFTRTDGAKIRFRLAWTRSGHRRALAWRCAELVSEATSELVNDPTASTWEIVVDDHEDRVAIELVPRGMPDERFAYRKRTVPASSHPVIAAALARLVAPREDDVVWDPFVGAGAELVERARLGPYAALVGSDVEASAIEAARANLADAGIAGATLEQGDATSFRPQGVTTIITNPPMGRRVHRGTHAELLERFVAHAASVLVPGGALVWACPDARQGRLHARAERAGLVLERAFTVDMGGFPAELSVHRKPARGRAPL
ncbi:MAG: methyltransferase [Labilithrix sp.]|nr:methyltransferase [Labilithrix sp.]